MREIREQDESLNVIIAIETREYRLECLGGNAAKLASSLALMMRNKEGFDNVVRMAVEAYDSATKKMASDVRPKEQKTPPPAHQKSHA